jgi:hypothetical protein
MSIAVRIWRKARKDYYISSARQGPYVYSYLRGCKPYVTSASAGPWSVSITLLLPRLCASLNRIMVKDSIAGGAHAVFCRGATKVAWQALQHKDMCEGLR